MAKVRIIKGIDGYSNRAIIAEINGYRFCISYYTIVAYQDKKGNFHRTWGGYSNTTKKHVNIFGWNVNKKGWENAPVEDLPKGFNKFEIISDEIATRKINGYSDNLSIYSKSAYGF